MARLAEIFEPDRDVVNIGQRNEPIEGLPALVPRGVRVVTVLACGRRRGRP